jgi:putative ABC transport system ATP-binding protein
VRLLEAFELYRFYHSEEAETVALRGVSLHLEAGELVAVQGPSGSGKSTLLACLAGLDEPDGGHVELLGQRLSRRSERERAARRAAAIGILLQSGNLFDHLTVEDNLRLSMCLAGRVDQRRLKQLLEQVGLLGRRRARRDQLSGGEAARAGLAVALAAAPRLLLADEPTAEVDAATEQQVLALLEAHRRDGGATLVVTHSERLAARADRVIHLRDGRIERDQ